MHYLYGKILHHLYYPDASGVKIPHEYPYAQLRNAFTSDLPVNFSFT